MILCTSYSATAGGTTDEVSCQLRLKLLLPGLPLLAKYVFEYYPHLLLMPTMQFQFIESDCVIRTCTPTGYLNSEFLEAQKYIAMIDTHVDLIDI